MLPTSSGENESYELIQTGKGNGLCRQGKAVLNLNQAFCVCHLYLTKKVFQEETNVKKESLLGKWREDRREVDKETCLRENMGFYRKEKPKYKFQADYVGHFTRMGKCALKYKSTHLKGDVGL